jgi:hypothetical protein
VRFCCAGRGAARRVRAAALCPARPPKKQQTPKGARFLAGNTTIKLRHGESYSFTLSVTPGLELG